MTGIVNHLSSALAQQNREIARLRDVQTDLLEALQWAATVIRPGSDLHNDIVAAIAKATGGRICAETDPEPKIEAGKNA